MYDRFASYLLLPSIMGLLATATGFANWMLANATGLEMPWPVQFGISGIFASLLWWCMAKTIPKISEDHRQAVSELGDKLDNLAATVKQGQDSQLNFFRDTFSQNRK